MRATTLRKGFFFSSSVGAGEGGGVPPPGALPLTLVTLRFCANLFLLQARRLGACSAGGDFFDHSSDSVSSSFAALIILHMLCGPAAAASAAGTSTAAAGKAAAAASGPQQECLSLAFLRHIPGLSVLLPHAGRGFRVCFQSATDLRIRPLIFSISFTLLSQIPFFIATWAHPIVGRTMLSASVDGPGSFSVDELNLLVIPGLLLLRALFPWVFAVSLADAVSLLPAIGPFLSSAARSFMGGFASTILLEEEEQHQPSQEQRQLTLGLCVLTVSVAFSLLQSSRLIRRLLSREHIPRFLPGVCFFAATFWFAPPLGLQIICFSLLCLELIAARLKLHVRSLLVSERLSGF
ncbi:CDP-alcohol phosphatidyltransferase domain-containing protein [Cyclospora cayetanensis]|uniref:CDP-alcohol phosphatidyltransferase domain-containing protein n=1 Tax=Cyclospora cayetanensis TaxID=88456 RepID=A0A1D3D334_9EIME|nr:CDP-alcohol phosphatidyltransferase domain-containing protein [Cyclospora cayetanensis]